MPSPIDVADLSARVSHAASNSFGSLYLSPWTMTAQAMRAILLRARPPPPVILPHKCKTVEEWLARCGEMKGH